MRVEAGDLRAAFPGRPLDVRLSEHARERCAEMGIRTKTVKGIVRDPELRHTTHDRLMAKRDDLAVVYEFDHDGIAWIVTVLRWSTEEWDR